MSYLRKCREQSNKLKEDQRSKRSKRSRDEGTHKSDAETAWGEPRRTCTAVTTKSR